MKFLPTFLFFILTMILVVITLGTWNDTIDITLQNSFYIISANTVYIPLTLFSLATTIIYFWFFSVKKNISALLSYLHLGLMATGIITLYSLIDMISGVPLEKFIRGTNREFLNDFEILFYMVFFSSQLMLGGLIVFIIGLTKALRRKEEI